MSVLKFRSFTSLLFGLAAAAPACAADDAGGGGQSTAAATDTGEPQTSTDSSSSSGSGSNTSADPTVTTATSGTTATSTGASTGAPSDTDDGPSLVDERPYTLLVPDSYDPAAATPLVLSLHGYGASGEIQSIYFGLTSDAQTRGYLVAMPDGLVDDNQSRFWDATDACCNFSKEPVDDVAYLNAVLDDVIAQYNVDPARIYVIGHSNGGFMAYRLMCETGERIAAMISLAGATWADPAACPAGNLVNVLQIHGTEDETIAYNGGMLGTATYPSAVETAAQWASNNGCSGSLEDTESVDLLSAVAGDETTQAAYGGCPPGGDVSLWTIEGGGHIPTFGDAWIDEVWGYFDAHPKP